MRSAVPTRRARRAPAELESIRTDARAPVRDHPVHIDGGAHANADTASAPASTAPLRGGGGSDAGGSGATSPARAAPNGSGVGGGVGRSGRAKLRRAVQKLADGGSGNGNSGSNAGSAHPLSLGSLGALGARAGSPAGSVASNSNSNANASSALPPQDAAVPVRRHRHERLARPPQRTDSALSLLSTVSESSVISAPGSPRRLDAEEARAHERERERAQPAAAVPEERDSSSEESDTKRADAPAPTARFASSVVSPRKDSQRMTLEDDPTVYKDVEIFYAVDQQTLLQEEVEWNKGIQEVKRLACALKYLLEDKDIETDIINASGLTGAYDGDKLVCTIASGAKSVAEFRAERRRLMRANQLRRLHSAAEKDRIKQAAYLRQRGHVSDSERTEGGEAAQVVSSGDERDRADGSSLRLKYLASRQGSLPHLLEKDVARHLRMEKLSAYNVSGGGRPQLPAPDTHTPLDRQYRITRKVAKGENVLPMGTSLSSSDDFNMYVDEPTRSREKRAYDVQWERWVADQRAKDNARRVRRGEEPLADDEQLLIFDPDMDLSEFEYRSYLGLMRFLFTRASVASPFDEEGSRASRDPRLSKYAGSVNERIASEEAEEEAAVEQKTHRRVQISAPVTSRHGAGEAPRDTDDAQTHSAAPAAAADADRTDGAPAQQRDRDRDGAPAAKSALCCQPLDKLRARRVAKQEELELQRLEEEEKKRHPGVSTAQAKADFACAMRSQTILERALNHYFVAKLRRFVVRLRKLESRPRMFFDVGNEFFHKIDNYLAVLLYRRKNGFGLFPGLTNQQLLRQRVKDSEELRARQHRAIMNEDRPERLNYWQTLAGEVAEKGASTEMKDFMRGGLPLEQANAAAVSGVSRKKTLRGMLREETADSLAAKERTKLCRFALFSVLMVSLVTLASAALYGMWSYSATYSLEGVNSKLRLITEVHAARVIEDATSSARVDARLLAGLLESRSLGAEALSLNATQNELSDAAAALDRILLELLQLSNSSSLFLAAESGVYIEVRKGAALAQTVDGWLAYSSFVRQREFVGNDTVNRTCIAEYSVDASTRARNWGSRREVVCTAGGSSAADSTDVRLSAWYSSAALPLSSAVVNETALRESGVSELCSAAALQQRLLGERWLGTHTLRPGAADTGVSYVAPSYACDPAGVVNGSVLVRAQFTNNSVVALPALGFALQLRWLLGASVAYSALDARMSSLRVGRSGVALLADVSSSSPSVAVQARSSYSAGAVQMANSLTQFLSAQLAQHGAASFKTAPSVPSCLSLVASPPNIRFSPAELADVSAEHPTRVNGRDMILTARDFNTMANFVLGAQLRTPLPASWLLVVAYPADDYFGVILQNSIATLVLGLLAMVWAAVMMLFVRELMPDMNALKRRLEEVEAEERERQEEEDRRAGRSSVRRHSRAPATGGLSARLQNWRMTFRKLTGRQSDAQAAAQQRLALKRKQLDQDAGTDTARQHTEKDKDKQKERDRDAAKDTASVASDREREPEERHSDSSAEGDEHYVGWKSMRPQTPRLVQTVTYGKLFGKEWPVQSYRYGVIFALLLVLGCFVLIAFLWSSASRDAVNAVAADLLSAAQNDLAEHVSAFVRVPQIMHQINLAHYLRVSQSREAQDFFANASLGHDYLPGNNLNDTSDAPLVAFLPFQQLGAAAQFGYDAYLYHMMLAFQRADGSFPIARIAAMFRNGDYADASIFYPLDGSAPFVAISAKDAFNGNCFTTYRPTGAGARDTGSVLFTSGGCQLDPRSADFYARALADGLAVRSYDDPAHSARGWTVAYVRSNSTQVLTTVTLPVLNVSNASAAAAASGALGVFAIDVNLDVLSSQVSTSSNISSCFARYFAMSMDPSPTLVVSAAQPRVSDFGRDLFGTQRAVMLSALSDEVDDTQEAAATFLVNVSGAYSVFSGIQQWQQPLGSPYLSSFALRVDSNKLAALSNATAGLAWLVVALLPYDVFLNRFEQFATLTTVFCVAIVVFLMFVARGAYNTFHTKLLEKEEARGNSLDVWQVKRLRRLKKRATRRSAKLKQEEESLEEYELRSLTELLRSTRPTVLQTSAYKWNKRRIASGEEWQPMAVENIRKFCAEEGIRHIRNALKGRDVLRLAAMEEHPSSIPRRVYKLYTQQWYLQFVVSVIVMHICLAFFEPNTQTDLHNDGPNNVAAMIELACLLVETFDICLGFLITIKWRNPERTLEALRRLKAKAVKEGNTRAAKSFLMMLRTKYGLTLNKDMFLDFIHAFVTLCVWFDFVLKMGAHKSYSYYFPIRVALLLFRSPEMRRTSEGFLRTMFAARDIVLLYIVNVIVFSGFALVLFRNTVTEFDASSPGPQFYDFFTSMVTVYIYVSTSDNYPEIVYPAYTVSPVFQIYFVVLTVLGTYFILAMVISIFQRGFGTQNQDQAEKSLLYSRTGIVAAFALLDLNGSERLSWNELQSFIDALRPVIGDDDPQLHAAEERLRSLWDAQYTEAQGRQESATEKRIMNLHRTKSKLLLEDELKSLSKRAATEPEAREDLFRIKKRLAFSEVVRAAVAAHQDDMVAGGSANAVSKEELAMRQAEEREVAGMNVVQFVSVVEHIQWSKHKFIKDINKLSTFRQFLQVRVFMAQWYREFMMVFIVCHLVVVALYGTVDTSYEPILDWLLFGFAWFHFIEICSRWYAFGWREFWHYQKFHDGNDAKYDALVNRFDFAILWAMILGFWISLFWSRSINFDSEPVDNKLHYNFVCTIPTFRVFAAIRRVRRLFFTLLGIIPQFADLIALLISVFFIFGTIAVNLLAYKFKLILQNNAPPANFDSIAAAFRALFQMLTGQQWSDLMYAGVKTTRNWSVAWLFMLFIATATLLFVNIFIGLVLEGFEKLGAEAEAAMKAQQALEALAVQGRDEHTDGDDGNPPEDDSGPTKGSTDPERFGRPLARLPTLSRQGTQTSLFDRQKTLSRQGTQNSLFHRRGLSRQGTQSSFADSRRGLSRQGTQSVLEHRSVLSRQGTNFSRGSSESNFNRY